MSLTISRGGDSLLIAATPLNVYQAGVYYCKRCKVDSVQRKVTIDSSPGANGSFAQDFGDHSWPISGGSLIIVDDSEQEIRTLFRTLSDDIKQQVGLTLAMDNESISYQNCVCTAFELMRRPMPDFRTVIPNGNGTFRAYIAMEFLQLIR